jgi:signal transduction histidine kinase
MIRRSARRHSLHLVSGARAKNGGHDELSVVHRLSAAILDVSRYLDTDEVLQTIVTTARSLLGAEYAALGVPDGAGSFARFIVDGVSDEQWRAIGPLPRQHGMLGVMLHAAGPQRLADIRAEAHFSGWPAAHPTMTAFLGMPIRVGGDQSGDERDTDDEGEHAGATLGAIYLANKPGGFTEADENLLAVLAAHAAIALTHARLYERSRELSIARERARIAHELHDAVAQKLFALRLVAESVDARLDDEPELARAGLAEIADLASEAAAELRDAVVELRPADLSADGLAETLRKQVTVLDRAGRAVGGPRLLFAADWCEGGEPALPPAHREVVLRVAQEALHNACRHAGAGAVRLTMRAVPPPAGATMDLPGLVLEIADDGAGFDVGAVLRAGRSLGLRSMRARARSVRGTLRVTSTPGDGTTIRLEVPGGRAN